ncbi:MAG: RNA methyltransferase [Chlamydiae bacterium]|nr:RNA methyltransferase [Chlamydiota bacterium]
MMSPSSITQLQHPLVKWLVSLRKEASVRKQEQKLLVMGNKIIQELLSSGYPIDILFSLKTAPPPNHPALCLVSLPVLQKMTGIPAPEPLAALVPSPSFQPLENKSSLLILDGIQDPGNLGTLLRTALALGWEGAYITQGSCDPFNDKALRAAKGATFYLPLQRGSLQELFTANPSLSPLIADLQGMPFQDLPPSPPRPLLLSSESHGVHGQPKGTRITISMQKGTNSLNVATAGAILLHYFAPKLPR